MRRLLMIALVPGVIAGTFACKPRKSKAPEWVQAAPAQCSVALSVQAGWVLDHENVQTLLARFPMADQMLDLFMKKARINPKGETGRVTFYVLDPPQKVTSDLTQAARQLLVLLEGFKDPGALQAAVLESFPQEGSMSIQEKDCPLHVIMDVNQVHIRAAVEPGGRIWLGDLGALGRMASQGPLKRELALKAAEWVDGRAPFQGMAQVEPLLGQVRGHIPKNMGLDIPTGVDTLAWSVTPSNDPKAPHRLDLALTGTPEAMTQVTPWLQRIGALASAAGPGAAQPPEIVSERTRAGLRASMTQDQLNAVLSKLGQLPIKFDPPRVEPKA